MPTLEETRSSNHVGAVRDVTLDVRTGEIFVIMGLSGSGKSTLVRCLSRLNEPSGGGILFNGQDLLEASASGMIDIADTAGAWCSSTLPFFRTRPYCRIWLSR